MRVREALAWAATQLEAVPGVPRLDAERLMAAALDAEPGELMLSKLDEPAPPLFESYVRRRLADEPLPYITGRAGFWTIDLEVGPGALIPRADSETLIQSALDHFGAEGPDTILDLGTGPGTLLLAALDQWPRARGLGIDRSETALAFAEINAARLGLAGRAAFRVGDWAEGIVARFGLVLCNPPYIESGASLMRSVAAWEPPAALYAGPDGLDAYRALAAQIGQLVAPGGVACLEIGMGQEQAVTALFEPAGFTISSRTDLNGIPRCLVLQPDRG